jgi:hypothetical protein
MADGALAWVCPLPYLRDRALPALRAGATGAGRPAPSLVAHCFLAVHEDPTAVRAAARDRLAGYPRVPFYQRMFARAGYPEARDGVLSEAMMDAVVVQGDEGAAGAGLRAYLEAGMDELCASILVVGETAEARRASLERALRLVATLGP